MTTATQSRYEIDVSDVEYLRHGDKPLLARLYKPRGQGPFPLIIDLHGGAWCEKNRTTDFGMNEGIAKSGIVVLALDFRMPPEAGYPASLADINYAIRWSKANAGKLSTRADMIGISGLSSGGHQAMLAAMRPHDPRYAALPLAGNSSVDATVRCAVLCWPVIDPLGRYHHAKKLKDAGKPKLADSVLENHHAYWRDEAAMAEGNPTLALERGERVQMPPVLYLQGTIDESHPRANLERFIASYREAGGRVDQHWFEGVGAAFLTNDPDSPASRAAIEKIIEFVHREIH